jgi:hypothetical protein
VSRQVLAQSSGQKRRQPHLLISDFSRHLRVITVDKTLRNHEVLSQCDANIIFNKEFLIFIEATSQDFHEHLK